MEIRFTPDQQAVIDHQEGNLLVSAAAGSGKTAVLVERIVRMVTDREEPVPVERMLVVTFTNAAARQMKEKIEGRIRLALEECREDPSVSAFLEEQYHGMAMASIMTNHAFCLQILQDYITRIPGLDPGFRVADETEIQLLRVDVLAQVLETFYTKALEKELSAESSEFLAFMDAYGGMRQDSQVEELLLSVYDYMESDPDPIGWLERSVAQMDPENWQDDNPWQQFAASQMEQSLEEGSELMQRLIRLLREAALQSDSKTADKVGKLSKSLEETLSFMDEEMAPQELAMSCKKISWPKMSYAVFKEDSAGEAMAKELVQVMKKAFERVGDLYDSFWAAEALEGLQSLVLPAMRGMKRLLLAFDAAYKEAKREKNLVEFSDFEHGALQILQDDAVAADLRERFLYIYIDEYQDSNRLQEAIIERIARKDENGQSMNVFMVGDVKQSIYRFRQADPSLFLDKYESYGKRANTRRLVLKQNFRSDSAVLDATNFIFEALMHKEGGELEYDAEQRLYQDRENEENNEAELCVLHSDQMDSRQLSEAEARQVAKRIHQLKAEGRAYRDMVILMRSVSGQADIYRKVLEEEGIPVYAESSENFYDTREIQTMMNLLHVLDNPRQDIPLMGVLYSPIGGLSEAELGLIRLAAAEGDFYDALIAYAAKAKQEGLKEKVQSFLDRLDRWRELSRVNTIHDLLWKLYEETGFYLYASSMPGGSLRRANLDLLLEKSIAFEKGIYSGLYQFLRYVEKLDKNRKTQEEAKILGEDEDLVRIMTIHKSKGLEFPVVFVVGLGRKWNTKDLDRRILLHGHLGIGAETIDSQHYIKYPSMTKSAIRGQLAKEMIAEEMRLLYVAMTRAEHQLLMFGARKSEDDISVPEKSVLWQMPVSKVLQAHNYMQWIEEILRNKAGSPIVYHLIEVDADKDEDDTCEMESKTANWNAGDENVKPVNAEDAQLQQYFSWQYEDQWMSRMPVRLSVSQIKQRQMVEELPEETTEQLVAITEEAVPADEQVQKKEAGGADRGTAFHAAMAQADWRCFANRTKLEAELQKLVDEGKITAEEEKLVSRNWLLGVGQSKLYKRMMAAEKIYKEKPFMMSLPLKELKELTGEAWQPEFLNEEIRLSGEEIMIQGMMDCYFMENGSWILVDYKTDWQLDAQRLEGYSLQLKLYAAALEKATGVKVRERILYDVRRGKEILC